MCVVWHHAGFIDHERLHGKRQNFSWPVALRLHDPHPPMYLHVYQSENLFAHKWFSWRRKGLLAAAERNDPCVVVGDWCLSLMHHTRGMLVRDHISVVSLGAASLWVSVETFCAPTRINRWREECSSNQPCNSLLVANLTTTVSQSNILLVS